MVGVTSQDEQNKIINQIEENLMLNREDEVNASCRKENNEFLNAINQNDTLDQPNEVMDVMEIESTLDRVYKPSQFLAPGLESIELDSLNHCTPMQSKIGRRGNLKRSPM